MMRPEQQWPGREGDDEPRHCVPAMSNGRGGETEPRHCVPAMSNGRRPRLHAARGGVVEGLPSPEPIDTDYQEIDTPDGGVIIRFGGPELLERDHDDEG